MSWAEFRPPHGPAHIEVQGALRQPGEWFPCEEPERPFDDDTALHDCCRPCLIGAQAAILTRGDEEAGLPALVAHMTARLDEYGPAPRIAR